MRHENLSMRDDRCVDGRVACLKFSDRDSGGELDLVFYTGRMAPYYNAASFNKFVRAYKEGGKSLQKWSMEKPCKYVHVLCLVIVDRLVVINDEMSPYMYVKLQL